MKAKIVSISICVLVLSISLWCYIKETDPYSNSERRYLKQFPTLSIESVVLADFMADFEEYALDQFPLRDTFRKIKAYMNYYVFNKTDNNEIIYKDGYLTKIEYPLQEAMVQNANKVFASIYDTYLKKSNVQTYLSIIPDKNYYLLDEDYLLMDYDTLVEDVKKNNAYMQYIDIFPLLTLEDYYYNDTHWKQENLVDVSNILKEKMNKKTFNSTYSSVLVEKNGNAYPFYGVYVGQYALNVDAENLYYLTNAILEACKVYSYSDGSKKEIAMYTMSKVDGKDAYEMYLNGSEALLTIENPNATSTKELVIFRDSFGSSIAPLLVDAYAKVTLIDIRYMQQDQIGKFVQFTNQDVLFLYSTILLNNSTAFK